MDPKWRINDLLVFAWMLLIGGPLGVLILNSVLPHSVDKFTSMFASIEVQLIGIGILCSRRI